MKKTAILLMIVCLLTGCSVSDKLKESAKEKVKDVVDETDQVETTSFGMLTGMSQKELLSLTKHYKLAVVKRSGMDADDVTKLHASVDKIYVKLNLTYVDKDNTTYKTYDQTLAGDVKYVKMTRAWKKHIKELVTKLKDMGYDGVYVKGLSFYNWKKTDKAYEWVTDLLTIINDAEMPVMTWRDQSYINRYLEDIDEQEQIAEEEADQTADAEDESATEDTQGAESETQSEDSEDSSSSADSGSSTGDTGEEEEEEEELPLISAVQLTEAFTVFDWETHKTEKQDSQISKSYKEFMDSCSSHGIKVYVVEYTRNSDWKAVIKSYCKKRGFKYYFASVRDFSEE